MSETGIWLLALLAFFAGVAVGERESERCVGLFGLAFLSTIAITRLVVLFFNTP